MHQVNRIIGAMLGAAALVGGGGGALAQPAPPGGDCGIVIPSAPVFPGPHANTIELRMIAHQREFAPQKGWWDSSMPDDPFAPHGVHNHAVMVAGGTLLAPESYDDDNDPDTPLVPTTPRYFVDFSVADVRASLEDWADDMEAANSDWFDRDTFTGFIILDIEHPVRPSKFREWFNDTPGAGPETHHPGNPNAGYLDQNGDPILLDHIIEGYITRIRAARLVFKEAKLAVFPMIKTPSDGSCTNSLVHNIKAWEYASTLANNVPELHNNSNLIKRRSWLDRLDYVCVQVYPRYGPATCDAAFYDDVTTWAFVGQALQTANRIAEMESDVGVLPMLAFNIHNPPGDEYPGQAPSCEDDVAATVEYVAWQLQAIRDYAFAGAPGFTIADTPICFWDGDGELLGTRFGGPQSLTQFMDLLEFSACDLNGVAAEPFGSADPDDLIMWAEAIGNSTVPPVDPFHMVFDVNGDRVVTTTGPGNDLTEYNSECDP